MSQQSTVCLCVCFATGQFLVRSILQRDDLELAFVWNRTKSTLVEDKLVDQSYIVDSLDDVADRLGSYTFLHGFDRTLFTLKEV